MVAAPLARCLLARLSGCPSRRPPLSILVHKPKPFAAKPSHLPTGSADLRQHWLTDDSCSSWKHWIGVAAQNPRPVPHQGVALGVRAWPLDSKLPFSNTMTPKADETLPQRAPVPLVKVRTDQDELMDDFSITYQRSHQWRSSNFPRRQSDPAWLQRPDEDPRPLLLQQQIQTAADPRSRPRDLRRVSEYFVALVARACARRTLAIVAVDRPNPVTLSYAARRLQAVCPPDLQPSNRMTWPMPGACLTPSSPSMW